MISPFASVPRAHQIIRWILSPTNRTLPSANPNPQPITKQSMMSASTRRRCALRRHLESCAAVMRPPWQRSFPQAEREVASMQWTDERASENTNRQMQSLVELWEKKNVHRGI
jgi:hypothetical protein